MRASTMIPQAGSRPARARSLTLLLVLVALAMALLLAGGEKHEAEASSSTGHIIGCDPFEEQLQQFEGVTLTGNFSITDIELKRIKEEKRVFQVTADLPGATTPNERGKVQFQLQKAQKNEEESVCNPMRKEDGNTHNLDGTTWTDHEHEVQESAWDGSKQKYNADTWNPGDKVVLIPILRYTEYREDPPNHVKTSGIIRVHNPVQIQIPENTNTNQTIVTGPEEQPEKTAKPVLTTPGSEAITATWSKPDRALWYHVTYSTDGGKSWSAPPVTNWRPLTHRKFRGETFSFKYDSQLPYIVAVRAGNYGGWSNWTNSAELPPKSLPQVSNLRAFYNSAYQGRVAVAWNKVPGATGYHVTLSQQHREDGRTNYSENHLVRHHHTGHWLIPTDWMSTIQLCQGDRIQMGVRPIYHGGGHWDGNGEPDVAGPWRNTATFEINKHDPIGAPRGHKCRAPDGLDQDNPGGGVTAVSAGKSGNNLTARWTPGVENARWFHVNYNCNGTWEVMPLHGKWEHSVDGIDFGGGYYKSGAEYPLVRDVGSASSCQVAVRAGNERGWAMNGPWESWGISGKTN